jgi:hypothetical protein
MGTKSRLVNIGIGTDTDTLSAILLQYRYRYRRYFYTGVSGAVSAILFRLIFADIRYRYNLPEEEILNTIVLCKLQTLS